MIIIKTKDKHDHQYKGRISITFGEKFLIIEANWRDGEWRGSVYDGYYYPDIISIQGEDEKG